MFTGYTASDPIGGPQPLALRNILEDTGIFSTTFKEGWLRSPVASINTIREFATAREDQFQDEYMEGLRKRKLSVGPLRKILSLEDIGLDFLEPIITSDAFGVLGGAITPPVEEAFRQVTEDTVNYFLGGEVLELPRTVIEKIRAGRIDLNDPEVRSKLKPSSVVLSAEEATAKYGIPGELPFDKPVFEAIAILKREAKVDELIRADKIARIKGGVINTSAKWGGALVGAVVDPINIIASFIPVANGAKWAAWSVRMSKTFAGRSLVRLSRGALEGVVGQALVEPLTYTAAQEENANYGMVDSMLAIAFGTFLGGGLHLGFGSLTDGFRALKVRRAKGDVDVILEARQTPKERVAGEMEIIVSRLEPETRANLMALAVRNMERGQVIKGLEAVARADPNYVDPRLAIQLNDAPAFTVKKDGDRWKAEFSKDIDEIGRVSVFGEDAIDAEEKLAIEFIKRKLDLADTKAPPAKLSEGQIDSFKRAVSQAVPRALNKSATKVRVGDFFTMTQFTKDGVRGWRADIDTTFPDGFTFKATVEAPTKRQARNAAQKRISDELLTRENLDVARPKQTPEELERIANDVRESPRITDSTPEEDLAHETRLNTPEKDVELEEVLDTIDAEAKFNDSNMRALGLDSKQISRLDVDDVTKSVDTRDIIEFEKNTLRVEEIKTREAEIEAEIGKPKEAVEAEVRQRDISTIAEDEIDVLLRRLDDQETNFLEDNFSGADLKRVKELAKKSEKGSGKVQERALNDLEDMLDTLPSGKRDEFFQATVEGVGAADLRALKDEFRGIVKIEEGVSAADLSPKVFKELVKDIGREISLGLRKLGVIKDLSDLDFSQRLGVARIREVIRQGEKAGLSTQDMIKAGVASIQDVELRKFALEALDKIKELPAITGPRVKAEPTTPKTPLERERLALAQERTGLEGRVEQLEQRGASDLRNDTDVAIRNAERIEAAIKEWQACIGAG